MRLWSLHPKYLDPQGLVALWREGLLAKKVLEGKTKGYTHHPQLMRFLGSPDPLLMIEAYLSHVLDESRHRNYSFDGTKLRKDAGDAREKIAVTKGQVEYEFRFLQQKLKVRNAGKYGEISRVTSIDINPVFELVDGEIEAWEKVKEI